MLRCTPLTLRTCYTQSVILNLGVSPMRRREFIAALSAAATLPISAHAQQPLKIWRIGVLESATRELNTPNMNVFLKTLREYGYIEGENLVIEYRSTGGRNERLPELVSELMRLKVNLMLVRGTPEILAVKKATSTIPVVMFAVADPVGLGVAASLSHPGGNIFLYDRGGDKATWPIEGASARNEADGVFGRFQELCGSEAMERSGIGGQAVELACQPIGYTKRFGCKPRF